MINGFPDQLPQITEERLDKFIELMKQYFPEDKRSRIEMADQAKRFLRLMRLTYHLPQKEKE